MSTRYVWGKYTVEKKWGDSPQSTQFLPIPFSAPAGQSNWPAGYTGSAVTYDDGASLWADSKSTCSIKNGRVLTAQVQTDITADTFMYTPYASGNDIQAWAQSGVIGSGCWYIMGNASTGSGWALTCFSKNNTSRLLDIYYRETEQTIGTFVANVSSSTSNQYPTAAGGGVSSANWYKYIGSDSVDPLSVRYMTEGIRPGDEIKVSVSPSAGVKYGGTIRYLYQYSLNGGSWTDIAAATDTSISFPVPANAKTVRFRVRAQDDMGFTSSTYVTGALVTVERLHLWVGVGGKARKGAELYVGVDGKARKAAAAYIGVNGRARRFL